MDTRRFIRSCLTSIVIAASLAGTVDCFSSQVRPGQYVLPPNDSNNLLSLRQSLSPIAGIWTEPLKNPEKFFVSAIIGGDIAADISWPWAATVDSSVRFDVQLNL